MQNIHFLSDIINGSEFQTILLVGYFSRTKNINRVSCNKRGLRYFYVSH